MHLIQAIVTTAVGIAVIFLFKEKPDIPVSPTALIERTKFFRTIKILLTDRHFMFIALFVAFTDGILDVYRIMMRDAFKNYGITSNSIAIYSLISVPFSLLSINLIGFIAGKIKKGKLIMVIVGALFFLCLVALIPLMSLRSANAFGLIQVLFQILGPPCASLGYEMAA